MLDQFEIDALLDSATGLAAEAGAEVGVAPKPRQAIKLNTADLKHILHMRFPVIVVLAERRFPLKQILGWNAGSIIEFDRAADSELDLAVGNRHVGRGQAVKVGEYFGLRITETEPVEERIRALGG